MKTVDLQQFKRLSVIAFLAIAILCSWIAPIDDAANSEVDDGLKRALVSFATARALNAVISVAQGTEIAIQPAGVGVILTPGQLLDPLNDLVEQFSNLMLTASVAFGVQKVLLSIGAHWLASSLLTLTAFICGVFYLRHQPLPTVLSRLLIVLLMIRFAIPVITLGTNLLFERFMAADYQASQQAISTTSGEMAKLGPPATTSSAIAGDNQGTLDKFKGWWSQNTDVKSQFEKLKQSAEHAAEHIIKLMVIFLLQTLLIPLLLLWGLYGLARSAFSLPEK